MIDPDKIYHVYPRNDLHEHTLKCNYPPIGNPLCECDCEPDWKQDGDSVIIVHNSFDGREGLEWTKELLNQ